MVVPPSLANALASLALSSTINDPHLQPLWDSSEPLQHEQARVEWVVGAVLDGALARSAVQAERNLEVGIDIAAMNGPLDAEEVRGRMRDLNLRLDGHEGLFMEGEQEEMQVDSDDVVVISSGSSASVRVSEADIGRESNGMDYVAEKRKRDVIGLDSSDDEIEVRRKRARPWTGERTAGGESSYQEQEKGERKRVSDKGKGKANQTEIDWCDETWRKKEGVEYSNACLEALFSDFPSVPKAHIRLTLKSHNSFYAPAYFKLCQQDESEAPSFKRLKTERKGKKASVFDVAEEVRRRLEDEREWCRVKRLKDKERKERERREKTLIDGDEEMARRLAEEIEKGEEEVGIECGCCYGTYGFSSMIQCSEAHLFCSECVVKYAQEQIGNRRDKIPCMDSAGCDAFFPDCEVRRVLPQNQVELLERIRTEKEVREAAIEGLESCPFCPFAMVIDVPEEKVFRCQKEDCLKISCRKCRKVDHLPKTCEEMDEDKKADGINKISEAMSEALLRICPNKRCENRFIKEDGCNKMTCPSCHTMSCYVCGEVVNGYEHFKNSERYYVGPVNSSAKCELWEDSKVKDHDRVEAARNRVAAEIKTTNAAVTEEDVKKLAALHQMQYQQDPLLHRLRPQIQPPIALGARQNMGWMNGPQHARIQPFFIDFNPLAVPQRIFPQYVPPAVPPMRNYLMERPRRRRR